MLTSVRSDRKIQSYARKMIDNEESSSKQSNKPNNSPKRSKGSSILQLAQQHQLPNIHKNSSSLDLLRKKQPLLRQPIEKYVPIELSAKIQIINPLTKQDCRKDFKLPSIKKSSSNIIGINKQGTNYLQLDKREKHPLEKNRQETKTQVSQGQGIRSQKLLALDRYASEHLEFLNRLEKVVVYTRMSSGATCVALPKYK